MQARKVATRKVSTQTDPMKKLVLIIPLLLTACAHGPVLLQVYGDGHEAAIREALEEFADTRDLPIERPEVVPATANAEITLVHSNDYESASVAWELADLLQTLGTDVRLQRVRLQNHLVTGRRVGVFVRDEFLSEDADDDEGVGQLICSRDDSDATILLYEDGTMEVHTYIPIGDEISGQNYSGTWQKSGGDVFLEPRDLGTIVFRATEDCIIKPDVLRSACDAELTWVSGESIPLLKGCPVIATNTVHVGFRD